MAEKKVIQIDADIKEALKEIKMLFNTMVEEERKAQKEAEETSKTVKDIGKASKNTEKDVKAISKGFKGLGLAIKAAGIGLLISAFNSMKEILGQNQRVLDTFSTAFETLSIVVNKTVDALFAVYDSVKSNAENFNGLKKVLQGVVTLGITPLKLGFDAIKLTILQAQLAWEQSFFGDKDPKTIKYLNARIKETKTSIAETGAAAVKATTDIYNNFGDAVGEIKNIGSAAIDELSKVSIKAAYEQAQQNTELANNAKLAAAQQSRLVEQYDRQAEKLRQIRDEERNGISARIDANNKLGEVLDQQEKAMVRQAELQIAAAQAQVNVNDNIENRIALTEALANKEAVLAQVEGFRSEQKINDLQLIKEREAEIDQFNKDRDALELENLAIKEQSKTEILGNEIQRRIDQEAEALESKRILTEQEIQLERQKIKERQMAVNAIAQFADTESGIGKALLVAKQALAIQELIIEARKTITFSSLVAARSSAAIAEGTAQTAKVGFPQNIPLLIGYAAQAIGIISAVTSSVGKAKSIAGSLGGGGGRSAPTPQKPQAPQAQAPNFNIVGQGGVNQLADVIGGQTNKPVKAYVVPKDVTSGQELERNTVDGASIG